MTVTIGSIAANEAIEHLTRSYVDGKKTTRLDKYKHILLEKMWDNSQVINNTSAQLVNVKMGAKTRMKTLTPADPIFEYSNGSLPVPIRFPVVQLMAGFKLDEMNLSPAGFLINLKEPGPSIKDLGADSIRFFNIVEEIYEDYEEGWMRDMTFRLWNNGVDYPDSFPGIRSFILKDPTANLNVFGINQASQPLWRNRYATNLNVSTPANGVMTAAMFRLALEMSVYGTPNLLVLGGSKAIEAYAQELRALSVNNAANGFATDSGQKKLSYSNPFLSSFEPQFDPVLDFLGEEKSMYFIDLNAFKLMTVQDRKKEKLPSHRPFNELVLYNGNLTYAGMKCKNRITSAVLTIA